MSQYETTVRYFDRAAELMGLSKNMQTLLLTPERELKVQVYRGRCSHSGW